MNLITIAKVIGFGIIVVAGSAFIQDQIDQKKDAGKHEFNGPYEKYMKRSIDAVLSSGALVALSPILLITVLLVRAKLGKPVIFTQERPGKNGKIFKLYKFRSMTDECDENGVLLSDDDRLPRFGRILRSTSLDELPELLNIIKGDMAVVGPRPLLVEYMPYYTEQEMRRHDVRPGLTGLAQVNGRNASTWNQRFEFDNYYVDNITLMGDLKIILETAKKVIKRSDILVGEQVEAGRLDEVRSRDININNGSDV